MTTPAPAAQSELEALIEEHADLILAIELAAGAAAVAGLVDQLGEIQRAIAALWVTLVGGLLGTPTPEQARRLTDTLADRLRGVSVSVSDTIRPYADRAASAGQQQALTEVGLPPVSAPPAKVSSDLERVIRRADTTVRERIEAALTVLQDKPLDTWDDVTDALSIANQARAAAERAAAWAVNAAAAEAVIVEADRIGAELVWLAERDACVACLAYSGETTTAGGSFPVGLTYGDKPVRPWPDPDFLPGPPLHNRCRCRLMIYFGHDTKAATAALPQGWRSAHVSYPAALRREADRSILRGWSLPSESERTRLRAAERLLLKGVKAPKTVKEYARRAVRRGGWPSRRVPTPPP